MNKKVDVQVDTLLKNKYNVHSYQQLETTLVNKLNSRQLIENSYAKCEILLDLANIYLHFNKRLQALQMLEQANELIIDYAYDEFLSTVYLLRMHLALLHNDWSDIYEFCELGITSASKYKRDDLIACFYLIRLQLALNDGFYEKAIIFGRLVLHFIKKQKGEQSNFLFSVGLFLVQAYVALEKWDEARALLKQLEEKQQLTPLNQLYIQVAKTFYAWQQTNESSYEEQLCELLQTLWQLNQFAEVKTTVLMIMKNNPVLSEIHELSIRYTSALQLNEEMIRIIENLAYHDQIRSVHITNANDEKIGYHTGQSYRKLLQEQVECSGENQYITIVTFVIWVNNPELLNNYLKVKFDYYVKIDQELSKLYPESIRGKYYPSSFCAVFITEQPLDLQEIAATCQRYLDSIELDLEGQSIYYRIHMGAAFIQKKAMTSLQALYEQADQSLYCAKVLKKTVVVYREE